MVKKVDIQGGPEIGKSNPALGFGNCLRKIFGALELLVRARSLHASSSQPLAPECLLIQLRYPALVERFETICVYLNRSVLIDEINREDEARMVVFPDQCAN